MVINSIVGSDHYYVMIFDHHQRSVFFLFVIIIIIFSSSSLLTVIVVSLLFFLDIVDVCVIFDITISAHHETAMIVRTGGAQVFLTVF